MDTESAITQRLEPQLRQACATLRSAWAAGETCRCEQLLAAHPELASWPDGVVELVYTEFVARSEIGQEPTPEELYRRFPEVRERIARLLHVHQFLISERAASSRSMAGSETRAADRRPLEDRTGGQVIGTCEVLEVLGRGGMGVVYRARQIPLDRIVAIKMIRWTLPDSEDRQRFRAEAQAAAQLQHPNIVQIFEVAEEGGEPYFVLEYVDGGSLADRLKNGVIAPRQAAEWIGQLARAAQYAHEQGVIHRDLKPANVLLSAAEKLKITDFGLAKQLADDSSITRTGARLGTPSYMSPEQADGAPDIGPASDIYGLGAVLYEMLTGRPPFLGATYVETLEQVRGQDPVSPRRAQPSVPRDLDTICLKCLHKDPRHRYASAAALADDVERFLSGTPIQARPVGGVERTIKWVRRQPRVAALCLLFAAGVVAAFLAVDHQRRRAEQNLQRAAEEAELKDRALEAEKLAVHQSRQQFFRAEQGRYVLLMGSANREYDAGNITKALERLDQCPAVHRGWEWRCLYRLCRPTAVVPLGRPILSLAAAPRQNRLALGSTSGELQLMDAATLKVIERFDPPSSLQSPVVVDVEFSRNEQLLAWLCCDARRLAGRLGKDSSPSCLVIRDLQSSTAKVIEAGSAFQFAFHPAGDQLVVVGTDRSVRLVDRTSGKRLATLREPDATQPFPHVAVNSGGEVLAVTDNQQVDVWNLDRRETIATLSFADRVLGVDFDRGSLLAIATARAIELWDWRAQRTAQKLAHESASRTAMAFDPEGTLLVAAGTSNQLQFWDSRIKTLPASWTKNPRFRFRRTQSLGDLRGHTSPITAVAFLGPNRLVSGGAADNGSNQLTGELRAWNVNRHLPRQMNSAATLSPDGRRATIAASGKAEPRVQVVDLFTGRDLAIHPIRSADQHVLNHDGSRLLLRSGRSIEVYDLATGERTRACELPDDVVIPVRRRNTPLGGLFAGRPITFVKALSPDGERFVVAEAEGVASVISSATGIVERKLDGHLKRGIRPLFSADGKLLAARQTTRIAVWSVESGELLCEIPLDDFVFSLAFDPTATRLAAACSEAIKMWEVPSGRILQEFVGHRRGIHGLVFSPDGHRLASAGNEPSLKLWDTRTGDEVLSLAGPPGTGPHKVAFSPAGKWLIATSRNGLVQRWSGAAINE